MKDNIKKITWLEYRAQVTGKTVGEIRQEMSDRGKKGGFPKGQSFTKAHKKNLSKAHNAKTK